MIRVNEGFVVVGLGSTLFVFRRSLQDNSLKFAQKVGIQEISTENKNGSKSTPASENSVSPSVPKPEAYVPMPEFR